MRDWGSKKEAAKEAEKEWREMGFLGFFLPGSELSRPPLVGKAAPKAPIACSLFLHHLAA